jgi:hypothetical protein
MVCLEKIYGSHIFGDRLAGKGDGLRTYKPSSQGFHRPFELDATNGTPLPVAILGPKSIDFHGPPLPMALKMNLPASKS